MDPDPTAVGRRPMVATVEITCSTPVRLAVEVLAALQHTAAVVFDHGCPVGVVTLDALDMARLAGAGDDVHVGAVMDFELVHVDLRAGERATLEAYREAAWRSLRRRHPCIVGE
jgi:hypothetical protein